LQGLKQGKKKWGDHGERGSYRKRGGQALGEKKNLKGSIRLLSLQRGGVIGARTRQKWGLVIKNLSGILTTRLG